MKTIHRRDAKIAESAERLFFSCYVTSCFVNSESVLYPKC